MAIKAYFNNGITVHFRYKGHLGPRAIVPYIRLSLISEALCRGSSKWNIMNLRDLMKCLHQSYLLHLFEYFLNKN